MKTSEEMMKDRDKAIKDAREILAAPYFVLDTETTGLNNSQMCQIAILQSNGMQYKSLVKPTIPIEPGATAVHGITDKDVEHAPSALEVVRFIPGGVSMVIYNAPFDMKVIETSLRALGWGSSPLGNIMVYDAMRLYSHCDGEWNEYFQNYKWHKLGEACRRCGINIDLPLHDAMSDVIMTDRLIHWIAKEAISDELDIFV